MIFEHQQALGHGSLSLYAEALGLDTSRWENDFRGRTFSERVQEDFISGMRNGGNGTPTFLINGRRHDGPFDADSLLAAMSAAVEGLSSD